MPLTALNSSLTGMAVRWRVGNRSSSHQQGAPINHNFELEEQEELNLTSVEVAGMALIPERWKLDQHGEDLRFIVSLNSEQNKQFEQILEQSLPSGEYLPVRLVGINDGETSWRFGRCLWEAADDGARHLVTLVSQAYDDERGGQGQFLLLQPEVTRMQQEGVLTNLRLDALIDELSRLGVINDDAKTRINATPEMLPFREIRRFDRADNVDDFFI